MPSVPAACGQEQRAAAVRDPRCARAAAGRVKPGSARARPVVDADGLRPGERAHRVDERARRGAPAAPRPRAGRAAARRARPTAGRCQPPAGIGAAAQHADAGARARRAAPGRSSPPAAAAGARRPRLGTSVRQADAVADPVDHAHAAGVDVDARPPRRSRPTRSAIAVALPPGAAATSATRSPGAGAEHRDDGLTALVLWRRPALAHRGQAGGVADAAHHERVRDERARGSTSTPADRSSSASASAVTWRGSGRRVTAAGSFIATSAARARAGAQLAREALDQPVGVRERHRVARRAPGRAAGDA